MVTPQSLFYLLDCVLKNHGNFQRNMGRSAVAQNESENTQNCVVQCETVALRMQLLLWLVSHCVRPLLWDSLLSHYWSCQGLGNDACLARCHRLVWTEAACCSDKKHIQARTMGSGEAGLDLSLCSLFVSRPPVFCVYCLTVLLGLRNEVIIGLNTDPRVVFLELL